MLRNARDSDGRVICPVCNLVITDEWTLQAGRIVYHRERWRPTEYREVGDNG